ncbi:MAG TPA: hypothetical protein VJV78_15215 [Polyangiales bacterium]|nr:hypothetical protein [Polyangiales bacterium]
MNAAITTVYLEGTPYVEGQALVFQSCAGSQCHAVAATGTARTGAPHGLNFDVSPITKTSTQTSVDQLNAGISEVRDEAETLWRVIDNGSMPPGKAGERGDLHWTDKTGTMDVMLTGLDLAEARDKVRNWLACAAPIVAATSDAPLKSSVMGLGAIADPGTPPASAPTWSSVYANVLAGCTSCHSAMSPYPNQKLDLSNPDTAYMQLVDMPTFSGSGALCGGRTLVKKSDCANSVLWQKLVPMGMTPPCGAPMPLVGDRISDANRKAVCDWINAGAAKN